MRIISIETSCDETAVAIVDAEGDSTHPLFTVRAQALYSQVALHKEFGGVFPTLAKREHAKNLTPLLTQALTDAGMYEESEATYEEDVRKEIEQILAREEGLYESLLSFLVHTKKPSADLIAVTTGPGLEPALWVGISFAKALSVAWGIPVVATNHMEGHIVSALMGHQTPIVFPALALLISGGHTELVKISQFGQYEKIGQTRDDAVGEAFDKVARMLGLPYPGGPEVSLQATYAREHNLPIQTTLPRPMIHSDNLDFSFSGLKTAVLYLLKEKPAEDKDAIADICRAFEDAVTDVLVSKTSKALDTTGAQTLIIAGGVTANTHIRNAFAELIQTSYPYINLRIASKDLSTDNAVMIAGAGYMTWLRDQNQSKPLKAQGNLSL